MGTSECEVFLAVVTFYFSFFCVCIFFFIFFFCVSFIVSFFLCIFYFSFFCVCIFYFIFFFCVSFILSFFCVSFILSFFFAFYFIFFLSIFYFIFFLCIFYFFCVYFILSFFLCIFYFIFFCVSFILYFFVYLPCNTNRDFFISSRFFCVFGSFLKANRFQKTKGNFEKKKIEKEMENCQHNHITVQFWKKRESISDDFMTLPEWILFFMETWSSKIQSGKRNIYS